MSTDTPVPAQPSSTGRTIDVSSTAPVRLRTLVKVEARKVFDTRAGRWFSIAILALVVLATGVGAAFFPEDSQTYVEMLGLAGGILGYFLPVLMILLVTSEWSQRTGLATFTLEPRRSRIVTAKLMAGALVAVAALLLGMVVAVAGTAASTVNGGSMVWDLGAGTLWSFAFTSLIGVLVGFAIAMLVRNSAAAIVGYFVYTLILPTVAELLRTLVSGLDGVIPWVEFNTAQAPLITGDYQASGQEWAQILVAGVIWLLVPVAVGVSRLVRAEVK